MPLLLSLLLPRGALAEAQPGECGTPDVLAALQGRRAARHPGMITPPPGLGQLPATAPPGGDGGKRIYGESYEFHIETANFTLQWWEPDIDEAAALAAADALETAWAAFIEEQGWPAPVSSDDFYVWVLLSTELEGATGYTTTYTTDDYPQGYPVIYLDPSNAGHAGFWSALAAHELMHAIQFTVRDWSDNDPLQSWYWEASATHSSELADPTWDGHQHESFRYAELPSLRYDALDGGHHYGMFVLNAWLDGPGVGPGTMQAAWALAADRPEDAWDTLIADTVGLDPAAVWAAFAGQYGNNELPEGALLADVTLRGALTDGASGSPGYLGADYWRLDQDATVTAAGEVLLGGPGGMIGEQLTLSAGDILSVTAAVDRADYTLAVIPLAEDTGDPDPPADTGQRDTGSGRGDAVKDGTTDAAAEGCASSPAPPSGVVALLLGLAGLRRRRRQSRSL